MTDGALREPTFLVLTALAAGPQHGYGILLDVEQISAGRVRLRAGTLYTALDRLTAEGYVRLVNEEIVNGRNRRSYGLTEDGAHAVLAEARRMLEAAALVIKTSGRSTVRTAPKLKTV